MAAPIGTRSGGALMASPMGHRTPYRGMLEGQYRDLIARAGQLVGVTGGSFAPSVAILNAIAVRRRPVQMRVALSARGPRPAVTGSVSVATPAAR